MKWLSIHDGYLILLLLLSRAPGPMPWQCLAMPCAMPWGQTEFQCKLELGLTPNSRISPRSPGSRTPLDGGTPRLRAKMDGVVAILEPRRIMTINIELRPTKSGSFGNGHEPVAGNLRIRPSSPDRAYSFRPEPGPASKTFDEILAPIREGWQQSGMNEEEITALFEETRDEVRKERRARKETP